MEHNYIANHFLDQIIRFPSSPALNYGDVESKKDFVNKKRLCLKEIRETSHCLRIIEKPKSYLFDLEVNQTKNESNQLISIVVVSIPTAKDNSEIKNC